MTIHIEALTFEVIIGLLDFERDKPQRIIVDIEASYRFENDFIDYADIVALVQTDLKTNRYILIEDALNGLKDKITTVYPQIKTLRIKIAKPDILPVCNVALSNIWEF